MYACQCGPLVFSWERVNWEYQPHHALQPGTRLQQILWEKSEGEAQQLSTGITRWAIDA